MKTPVSTIGKVYLVGAGIGDIGYLTVRSHQILASADTVVYDALISLELLDLVPTNCQKIDVGKRGGQPSTPQAEINQLLVTECQLGKQVVRLKSGDPFIFGRSASEIQALVAAGCHFEVIPGISSALAAPLLAGIPLTDPVLSRCFAVVTAHQPNDLNWEALAGIDTLVILMGGRNLKTIITHLHRHGRSLQTPVAIIHRAGSPQQQIWEGNLGNIPEKTAGVSLSPAVIVVGEVAGLRPYLQSPGKVQDEALNIAHTVTNQEQIPLPLANKTILVTRSAGQSSEFSTSLQQAGAKVIEMPTLEIGAPSTWEPLDGAIAQLSSFNWLILTSSNGVEYFFERLSTQGQDTRALAGLKIAVVGKKTAQSLAQYHLQPDFIPPNFVADSLVENFPETIKGQKILFPRVESGGREVLVKELTAQGAEVMEVPGYESRCPEAIAPPAFTALQRGQVDIITFASSKTVHNFCELLKKELSLRGATTNLSIFLQNVGIASIGPQTSQTCIALLGRVDVEAQEYTMTGLQTAIALWVERSPKIDLF